MSQSELQSWFQTGTEPCLLTPGGFWDNKLERKRHRGEKKPKGLPRSNPRNQLPWIRARSVQNCGARTQFQALSKGILTFLECAQKARRQGLFHWLPKTSKTNASTDFIRRISSYSQEGTTSTFQTGREPSCPLPGSTVASPLGFVVIPRGKFLEKKGCISTFQPTSLIIGWTELSQVHSSWLPRTKQSSSLPSSSWNMSVITHNEPLHYASRKSTPSLPCYLQYLILEDFKVTQSEKLS